MSLFTPELVPAGYQTIQIQGLEFHNENKKTDMYLICAEGEKLQYISNDNDK